MKKIVTVFFACICGFAFSQSWSVLTTNTTNHLLDVFCLNNDTVFAVGDNGIVIMTTDGGENWSSLNIGVNCTLSEVYFINDSIGFLCSMAYLTDAGKVFKTTDMGETWTDTVLGITPTMSLYGMTANNEKIFVIGMNGVIFSSGDTGETWDSDTIGVSVFRDIYFPTNDTGYVVSQIGGVYRTTDGGDNWDSVSFVSISNPMSIGFVDGDTGIVVGISGGIMKTTDAGETWDIVPFSSIVDLYSVRFYYNTGYIVGNNATILTSSDYGSTWQDESISEINNFLYDIQFSDSIVGYAIGGNGTVVKHNITTGIIEKNKDIGIYPNPASCIINVNIDNKYNEDIVLDIYNIMGGAVRSEVLTNKQKQIDISSLNNGLYMVAVKTKDLMLNQKLIIQR